MLLIIFFFFKQKTAYEMRISDWSSDVCSSDLVGSRAGREWLRADRAAASRRQGPDLREGRRAVDAHRGVRRRKGSRAGQGRWRSEEHTSELQSLMRISYAVFCLKKQNSATATKPH